MGENFLMRWELHDENRSASLNDLWKNERFLDVTIVCDDDQIEAHKLMLSAASPFFQKILLRSENHVGRPLLYLKGTRKKQIHSLLEFIYKGEVRVHPEDIEGFMHWANIFEIEGLVGDLKKEIEKPDYVGQKNYSSADLNSHKTELVESIVNPHASLNLEEKITTLTPIEDAHLIAVKEDHFSDSIVAPNNIDEYDEIVQALILISKNDGIKEYCCKYCPFKRRNRGHVMDHVEKHIEGFRFQCSLCGNTYRSKGCLRTHVRRCKSKLNEMLNTQN